MANSAGNTHSSERICARGGAPGGAAHGQTLALFTVAAAFRATRWWHNLDTGKDRSPREGRARLVQPLAQPGRTGCWASRCLASRSAGSSQVTKSLRVALRGSESKEIIYRKKGEEQRERWARTGITEGKRLNEELGVESR